MDSNQYQWAGPIILGGNFHHFFIRVYVFNPIVMDPIGIINCFLGFHFYPDITWREDYGFIKLIFTNVSYGRHSFCDSLNVPTFLAALVLA